MTVAFIFYFTNAENDATLNELRSQLAQKTGVLIERSTLARMLTKLELTVKKNIASDRKKE